eukprot:5687706-Amphidinium_carterae.1
MENTKNGKRPSVAFKRDWKQLLFQVTHSQNTSCVEGPHLSPRAPRAFEAMSQAGEYYLSLYYSEQRLAEEGLEPAAKAEVGWSIDFSLKGAWNTNRNCQPERQGQPRCSTDLLVNVPSLLEHSESAPRVAQSR